MGVNACRLGHPGSPGLPACAGGSRGPPRVRGVFCYERSLAALQTCTMLSHYSYRVTYGEISSGECGGYVRFVRMRLLTYVRAYAQAR